MKSASKPLTRVQAARRADIVDKLLPIVESLLDGRDSFASLSVEEIIIEAGMGRSTFYRYFGDKNELLLALSEPALAAVRDISIAPWQCLATVSREKLRHLIAETAASYRPHVNFMNAMVESATHDPQVKQQFLSFFTGIRKNVGGYIAQGQKIGRFRADLDADSTSGWFTWMVERGMYQMASDARPSELERLIESLASIMWYTLIDPSSERSDTT
jgi:AcrR family transcriptional regulator